MSLRLGGRVLLILAQAFQHHHEFIATQATHDILLAHVGDQALGHLDQQPVADIVALRVVQGLELIQVQDQQRAELAAAMAGAQGLAQPIHQQAPVGQPGERVEIGQVADLLLHPLALGDVAHQAQHIRLSGKLKIIAIDFHRKGTAVGGLVAALECHRLLDLELRPESLPLLRLRHVAIDIDHPQFQERLTRLSKRPARLVVHIMKVALLVGQVGSFRHMVQREIHQSQLLARAFAFGDVACDAEHAEHVSAPVAQRGLDGFEQGTARRRQRRSPIPHS